MSNITYQIIPIAFLFIILLFLLSLKKGNNLKNKNTSNALEINKSILEAKPTDGLWDDNRTDEQQLNASYEELEWAMKQTYNGKKTDSFSTKERQILTTFYEHNNANKHKMNPIPVCNIPIELK